MLTLIGIVICCFLIAGILIWPQVGLAVQLVGIIFVSMAVNYLGYQFGVSYVLLGFLLFGLFIFLLRARSRFFKITPEEMLFVLFTCFLICSLFYTTTPSYGRDKVQLFIAFGLAMVVACRIFGETPECLEKTLKVLSRFALLELTFYILLFIFTQRTATSVEGRFSGGIDDLIVGWANASAVVLAGYLIMSRTKLFTKIISAVLMLAGLVVIVATGSRGPFVGLLIGSMITFMQFRKMIVSSIILAFFGIIALTALYYFAPVEGRERVLSAFTSTSYEESGRPELFRLGLELYGKHFLIGGGSGSFAYHRGWGDNRGYPHNFFVEVAAETGTIGLIIVISMFLLCIKPILFLRTNQTDFAVSKTVQWLFWVGLANAMVSFDIPEQRALFASMGFLAAIRRWSQTNALEHGTQLKTLSEQLS